MPGTFSDQFQMTRRTRHQLDCTVCGLLFPAVNLDAKYCSNACRVYAFRSRRKEASALAVQPELINTATDQPPALSAFSFENRQLRVVADDAGNPWFVAADVCSTLGICNVSQALARVDDDERGMGLIQTTGGAQSMATVNEHGLYSLALGSRKPEARRFKRWVTHEVLPAIRRTGSYATPAAAAMPTLAEGVHVVASDPRHANWLWMQAVENQLKAALMTQYPPTKGACWTGPAQQQQPFQLHLIAA